MLNKFSLDGIVLLHENLKLIFVKFRAASNKDERLLVDIEIHIVSCHIK